MENNMHAAALRVAMLSPCHNRKVGALLLSSDNKILASGYNHTPDGTPCEDIAGATEAHVIHAEIAAITAFHEMYKDKPIPFVAKILVTHAPCPDCLAAIKTHFSSNTKIEVVEAFMKFDSDKLRYDLIPNSWHEGDAEILTFGAKKYKPNNWRYVEDAGRYIAALERHLSAFKKAIETGDFELMKDEDSGLHHLKHLRTNAGFLLTLTENVFVYSGNQSKGLFDNLETENGKED